MDPINLRALHAHLSSLPNYSYHANSLSHANAARIAKKYGLELADCLTELTHANKCGAQTERYGYTGEDALYPSAERLFEGYLYEAAREDVCDSEASARRED